MSNLRAALTGDDWIHAVDVASVAREDIDVSVLHEPTPSGAPLLVDWYRRHQASPKTMFQNKGASRDFLHTLMWRLVDAGFDPKTRWSWTEEAVSSLRSAGLIGSPVDLLDVMLEEGSPRLLSELESRWGEVWSPDFLSHRIRRSPHPEEPGVASLVPWFHYDVARDNRKMVQWWLSRGVDVNLRDDNGQTALFHATSAPMTRLLLSSGVDASAVDKFDRSAFEHWLDLSYSRNSNKPSRVILSLPSGIRKGLPPSILACAVEREVAMESKLDNPLEGILSVLRPSLLQSFRFGLDPEGKIYPTMPRLLPTTLLEMATKRPLVKFEVKNLQVLGWLFANTPVEGMETLADYAGLALLSFNPRDVCQGKNTPVHRAMSFPHMIDVAQKAFQDKKGISLFARERIVPMLLNVGACVLECASDQGPTFSSNNYRSLVDPYNPHWFDESVPGGSMLSRVLSCAMDLADNDSRTPSSIALARAMVTYVHAGLTVPQDTLLPVLRILGRLSPAQVKGSALGSSMTPGDADMKSIDLALGAAWWLTAGTPPGEDALEASGASGDFKNSMSAHLGGFQGSPWPEWMSMWESRRMGRALPEPPLPSPVIRSRF